MRLHVELSGQFIGELSGDERTFDFTPARTAIDHFGVGSRALSARCAIRRAAKQGALIAEAELLRGTPPGRRSA